MSDLVHSVGRSDGRFGIQPSSPGPTTSVGKTLHPGFDQVLQNEVARQQAVRFSHHALDRLRTRNIQLSSAEVESLSGAVQRVAEKGGRDSLVLMNNVAFVVNIPSRTVITAIDDTHLYRNVFTKIDSAVIV